MQIKIYKTSSPFSTVTNFLCSVPWIQIFFHLASSRGHWGIIQVIVSSKVPLHGGHLCSWLNAWMRGFSLFATAFPSITTFYWIRIRIKKRKLPLIYGISTLIALFQMPRLTRISASAWWSSSSPSLTMQPRTTGKCTGCWPTVLLHSTAELGIF